MYIHCLSYIHTAPGTVTFEQSKFVSSEELGWAVLCASVSGLPLTATFSLAVSTYDITASQPLPIHYVFLFRLHYI